MEEMADVRRSKIMELPGSIRADFSCTLIHQALTPSPLGCEYFNKKIVQGIMHEFCGNLDLTSKKGVEGGSWSKENSPNCYLCNKFKKNHKGNTEFSEVEKNENE